MVKLTYLQSPTNLFITLSCFISVITWFGDIDATLRWLVYDQQRILSGQIWRLLTPIFLHFDFMGIIFAHLVFNMLWLYQFGHAIEKYDSKALLTTLVLTSGVLSNIIQSFFYQGIFGGMSGVVYALLGYLFIRGKLDLSYRGRIADNIAYFLIAFMLIAALGILGSIANAAHFTGFFTGIVFAIIIDQKQKHRKQTF